MNNQQQQFYPPNFFSPSPSTNSGMPNSEVNWAQLAQRWIHTHQQQQQQQQPYPPPPPPTSGGGYQQQFRQQMMPPHQPPFPPQSGQPGIQPLFPQMEHQRHPAASFYSPQVRHLHQQMPPNQWQRPPWMASPQPSMGYSPHYPSMTPQTPHHHPASMPPVVQYPLNEQGGTSLLKEEEEYQAHYDPSLEQEDNATDAQSTQKPLVDAGNGNTLPEGAMSHWMVDPQMWSAGAYVTNYMPIIDTHMRKKLPPWILEGLEKAEKEKQKKLEKEEMERKRKELQEERRQKREAKGLGKFDSDSEEEEADEQLRKGDEPPKVVQTPQAVRRFREFVEEKEQNELDPDDEEAEKEVDERTMAQRREEALILMRKLITSVLLDCTTRELERVGEETLAREKLKAQPKILAKSSALAALSSLGDDDDDDSEDSASANGDVEAEGTSSPRKPGSVEQNRVAAAPSVFKVPLAPQPKRAKLEADESETKPATLKAPNRKQEVDLKTQDKNNGKVTREEPNKRRNSRGERESRREDDHLPSQYRSSSSSSSGNKNGDREKERGNRHKDRNRDEDRERDRNRDRERDRDRDRNHGSRGDDRDSRKKRSRSKSRERERSRATRRSRSRTRSRSPRESRNRRGSHSQRERSPRR